MAELWDIYDDNKRKTGKKVKRDEYQFKDGEYHIVVQAIIINSRNQILISKRAKHKKFGLMWECNGGSILAGETSLEGIGIMFNKQEAIFFKEIKRKIDFKDIWIFRKNIDIDELTFSDGEVLEAKWVTIEEFMEMINKKEIVPTIDFGLEDYNQVLKLKVTE